MIPISVKHFMCLGLGGALVSTLATMSFVGQYTLIISPCSIFPEDNDVLCPYV
jgi:hypothetical protein